MVVDDPSQFSQRGIEGPPLLVVEILSPSNARHDRVTKAARYLALGVKHYWIVDPRRRHLLCQRAEDGRWVVVAEGLDDSRVSDPSWPELSRSTCSGLLAASSTIRPRDTVSAAAGCGRSSP